MSNRFLLFLLAVWYPIMFIGPTILVTTYAGHFQSMSVATKAVLFYLYVLVFFAPGLWDAFGPRRERKDGTK